MATTDIHTTTRRRPRRTRTALLALVAVASLGTTLAATTSTASAATSCDGDTRTFEVKRGTTTIVTIRVAAYGCVGWARNIWGGYSPVVTTPRVSVSDAVVNSYGSKPQPMHRYDLDRVNDSTGRFMVTGIYRYEAVYKYDNGWITRLATPRLRIDINANSWRHLGREALVTIDTDGGDWDLNYDW